MRTIRTILLISLCLVGVASAQSEKPFIFEKKGTLPSGTSYELKVKEAKYVAPPQLPEDDCGMWGVDCGNPRFSVNSFSLIINKKKVHWPFKFVSDLGNVWKVEIKEINGAIKVVIYGGDAAGSYNAEFLVKNYRLVERIVHLGEFPDEIWEKTTIHNDILDYPDQYN